ncbi:heme oxygenase [Macrococcus brunensis]|uniref:Signal transduction protein TRAP n=1 Tax=Macrococcus brunensis TaxID=198483 RepID=A0A4R6BE54_9STAP|nr:heme oxygenase [Macrococcus brunensis]TDL98018.1 heme oxygenase [Macrococcus brunensis]ULG72346.1 heme oxygenase [Macrococcus brunensis]ULG74607.1 heme oxygenase [Macrococcus brunensis]
MFIVSNRIKMKSGFAEKMAPRFTQGGGIEELKGFVKTEVLAVQGNEEHDELHVNTYWETLEDFEAWKTSDAFKKAHQRPAGGNQDESPILGSELVIYELKSQLER